MLWEACMGLLAKERALIQKNYFRVWDIVEMLSKDGYHSWDEVGKFLGHYDFDTELTLYKQDAYCRIHEVHNDYLPIRKLIDGLNMVWLEGEELIPKIKLDIISYYWPKHEIYNFKPIMDLGVIEQPPTQVVTVQSVQESRPDKYKFFLYKQPLFSIDDCTCIISDYDPLEIQRHPGNEIDEIAPDYSRAYSFVNSSIEAGKLNIFNYKIDADDFRNYLASENIIIAGFNDQIAEPLHTESTKVHAEFKTTIANLELDLAIEKTTVQNLNEEVDHLKAEIAKLEAAQAVQQDCLLSQIFDESTTERYAPDLALSIKLWEHIYITHPKSDSHSNKAIKWLENNTGYEVNKKTGSASKIREITTPFLNWGNLRDKNYKK